MAQRSLTIKQRKFLREYVRTGNGTEAALVAYNTTDRNTAHVIAAENLQRRNIQRALAELLDEAGLTDGKLGKLLMHYLALYAADDPRLMALGLRALDMAFKIKGVYRPQEKELDNMIDQMTLEELDHYCETQEWPDWFRDRWGMVKMWGRWE